MAATTAAMAPVGEEGAEADEEDDADGDEDPGPGVRGGGGVEVGGERGGSGGTAGGGGFFFHGFSFWGGGGVGLCVVVVWCLLDVWEWPAMALMMSGSSGPEYFR